ncbi:MAG: hypothetical protein IT562_17435 [Alphaproteobacteria bacterium]|nr:hypothetical protein [Alphaproteobacteria bacterium]
MDVLYIDNIFVRMARPIQTEPFDFGTLPIQLRDFDDTYALMNKTATLFHQNLQSAETLKVLAATTVPKEQLTMLASVSDKPIPAFLVFDMMFVALRKTPASPKEFVTPVQGIYAAAKRPTAAAAPPPDPLPSAKKGFWRSLFR